MDLRVKKTKRAIRNAFAQLLQQKPFEKITVREITQLAEINKTTFYAHYDGLYALIAELEQEAIDQILSQLDKQALLTTQPRDFVMNLYNAMEFCRSDAILSLSTSSQSFITKLEKAIVERLAQSNIAAKDYVNVGAIMVFLVSGLIGLQKSMQLDITDPQLETLLSFIEAGFRVLPQ